MFLTLPPPPEICRNSATFRYSPYSSWCCSVSDERQPKRHGCVWILPPPPASFCSCAAAAIFAPNRAKPHHTQPRHASCPHATPDSVTATENSTCAHSGAKFAAPSTGHAVHGLCVTNFLPDTQKLPRTLPRCAPCRTRAAVSDPAPKNCALREFSLPKSALHCANHFTLFKGVTNTH